MTRTHPIPSHSALLLIDIQHDFLPGGALAVPEGDQVIEVANRLLPRFPLVVATQDWHPPEHLSFAANHPNKNVSDTVMFGGREQALWPVHCVQGSEGAALAEGLDRRGIDHVHHCGARPDADGYSGFEEAADGSRPLADYLRERQVETVYVMGLATDYCVQATAIDARRLGFETYLIEDGCRGIDSRTVDRAREEMRAAGVRFVHSDELGEVENSREEDSSEAAED